MKIKINRLNHVQLCIPVGAENKAREFYSQLLGLTEIPKPVSLQANGGLWYEVGDIELHIGVENMNGEKSKRHPAFEVENLIEVKQFLHSKKVIMKEEIPIPNVERFSFFDPFGNRIEFLQKT
ncbi:VOC family protein [Sutcliffiella halmapala]|uniref:VOC family protein n=1 Tax=Sutcliffiella halmapala TaxID=79882 RepID=UPI000994C4ED|nr:VOC family protein [Sutcliffiella halmapala]